MVNLVSEKVKNTLKDLGLTEYETRAYIALVRVGPTTARNLSEKSDLPHSRIYDVLSDLEARGWVESQSGRPIRYRAKSPSEAMRLFKIKQEEKFKESNEIIQQELEPLYEKSGEMEKPDIWTIRGETEVISKIEELVASAEIEILVSVPSFSGKFSELKGFIPLLRTRDLSLRILTSGGDEHIKELEKVPGVEIKCREPLYGGGVIIDGREALIVLGNSDRVFGIWSDDVALVKFAEEYFEYLWNN